MGKEVKLDEKATKKVEEVKVTKPIEPPKLKLYNPNRYVVPVSLNKGGKLTQVNVPPRKFIEVQYSELTDCVRNLIDPGRSELVLK